jgi:hypothetical protein
MHQGAGRECHVAEEQRLEKITVEERHRVPLAVRGITRQPPPKICLDIHCLFTKDREALLESTAGIEGIAVHVDEGALGYGPSARRKCLMGAQLEAEFVSVPYVVGIEERNPFAGRSLDPRVARGSGTRVFLPDISNTLWKSSCDARRIVAGAVINDNDFGGTKGLCENRPYGFADVGSAVVRRDDYRDRWWHWS